MKKNYVKPSDDRQNLLLIFIFKTNCQSRQLQKAHVQLSLRVLGVSALWAPFPIALLAAVCI